MPLAVLSRTLSLFISGLCMQVHNHLTHASCLPFTGVHSVLTTPICHRSVSDLLMVMRVLERDGTDYCTIRRSLTTLEWPFAGEASQSDQEGPPGKSAE